MLICLFQLQWHRFLHVKLAIQVTIGSENVGTPNRQQAIIYTYNNKVSHLVKNNYRCHSAPFWWLNKAQYMMIAISVKWSHIHLLLRHKTKYSLTGPQPALEGGTPFAWTNGREPGCWGLPRLPISWPFCSGWMYRAYCSTCMSHPCPQLQSLEVYMNINIST